MARGIGHADQRVSEGGVAMARVWGGKTTPRPGDSEPPCVDRKRGRESFVRSTLRAYRQKTPDPFSDQSRDDLDAAGGADAFIDQQDAAAGGHQRMVTRFLDIVMTRPAIALG